VANKYAMTPAVVQLASGASVFVDAGSLWPSAGAVVTGAPALFPAAMTLGATTVASLNPNPVAQSVTITGGTVTVIAVSGVVTGLTTGTFTVPAGGSVTVTYSVAPSFTVADIPPAGGTYPFVSGVLAGYLAAYPNGPQVS
jgi:hypothetical protein